MSDELEELTNALRGPAPRLSAEARARIIAAATAEFARHHQGLGRSASHKGRTSENGGDWFVAWLKKFAMPGPGPAVALTTAAFLIAAGFILRPLLLYAPPLGDAPSDQSKIEFTLEPYFYDHLSNHRSTPMEEALRRAQALSRYSRTIGDESKRAMSDPGPGQSRDRFSHSDPSPVKVTSEEPVSTFSIDVDTAFYSFIRASLRNGMLPQKDAVRTEELINYFPYDYAPPESRDTPIAAHVSLMPAPWNEANRLMHIGIKGFVVERSSLPRANLVFLIDTSGSMGEPDKLPLLIDSFKLLLSKLAPDDTVAIVTYADSAGIALPPTRAAERDKIAASLGRLDAGGSTAGAEGIRQAYLLAEQHFVENGSNRVILATDGDFNVGMTDLEELEGYIARKRDSGVFLSVLGFGTGNYNDQLMQRLAQSGNGNAAYIDSLSEARKALVEEVASSIFPIARDVKVQVEFNPAAVSEYRLIGYETRLLKREDLRNDKVDAGEIGAGHTVTAIYELTPVGSDGERIAPLRYQTEEAVPDSELANEFAFLRIRYKLPDGESSTEMLQAVTRDHLFQSLDDAPPDARFAAAVAAFGQLLRGGQYTTTFRYDDVIALAQSARGEDPYGYRSEFIDLVRLAQTASAMAPLSPE